jgi:hypothetical protein
VTTIDFFEKEVKRLQERFNATIGQEPTANMRARHLAILAICWADILARSVKKASDEKRIGEITREFCNVREGLNRFFDLIEPQPERREHDHATDKRRFAAGG